MISCYMLVCKKHPKYVGKAKPRSTCECCWAIWFDLIQDRDGDKWIYTCRCGYD